MIFVVVVVIHDKHSCARNSNLACLHLLSRIIWMAHIIYLQISVDQIRVMYPSSFKEKRRECQVTLIPNRVMFSKDCQEVYAQPLFKLELGKYVEWVRSYNYISYKYNSTMHIILSFYPQRATCVTPIPCLSQSIILPFFLKQCHKILHVIKRKELITWI